MSLCERPRRPGRGSYRSTVPRSESTALCESRWPRRPSYVRMAGWFGPPQRPWSSRRAERARGRVVNRHRRGASRAPCRGGVSPSREYRLNLRDSTFAVSVLTAVATADRHGDAASRFSTGVEAHFPCATAREAAQ